MRWLRIEIYIGACIGKECQIQKVDTISKIIGSEGIYTRFENNKIQDIIQKKQLEIVKKKL